MVGAQIARLRDGKEWSRHDLADRLGVDDSTVAYWERGDSMPRPDMLKRIAKHFGVAVSDLFKPVEKRAS